MSNVVPITPMKTQEQTIPNPLRTTELFGAYVVVHHVDAWQAAFAGEVAREHPLLHAEVAVEIAGHRSLMTLEDFATRIFGEEAARHILMKGKKP